MVRKLNLHCHTTYSYNADWMSPRQIAELAKRENWIAAGIVDFDVLDGLPEFQKACAELGVLGTIGIESRVFFSEMADKELNSPGEPGISYHMGVGFPTADIPAGAAAFCKLLKKQASDRTRMLVAKVNTYLGEIAIDYDTVAKELTPAGNVTERHVCFAYRKMAEKIFADSVKRNEYWGEKLGKAPEGEAALEALIRSKTMKQGGVGYVPATPESFPLIDDMNRFILEAGAVPTITWLNGESAGEADPGYLIDLEISKGAAFINIIPERNWNFADAELKARRVANLNAVIKASQERHLPIIIGTEMNAPGLPVTDNLDSDALSPHADAFIEGAYIACAHSALALKGEGYLSDWAQRKFGKDTEAKNRYFADFGRSLK